MSTTDALLDVEEVARLIEVKPKTVRSYHKKGLMPKADKYFGRSPAWRQQTITDWTSTRPRAGRIAQPNLNKEQ